MNRLKVAYFALLLASSSFIFSYTSFANQANINMQIQREETRLINIASDQEMQSYRLVKSFADSFNDKDEAIASSAISKRKSGLLLTDPEQRMILRIDGFLSTMSADDIKSFKSFCPRSPLIVNNSLIIKSLCGAL